MRPRGLFALLLVVLCLTSSFIWAQSSTTSLRGTVTDASGAAVAAAKVTLSNPERAIERATTTGAVGAYEFLQLPPGTYQLGVEMAGFRKYEQRNVQLLISTPATVNVTLAVGATSETVEVTGEAAHVNTTDATIGNAFGTSRIMELPFEGRNPVEMLSLQPGVTYTGPSQANNTNLDLDSRSGAVNGGRSDQANVTLDGVDNNDQNNGFAFVGALRSTLDSVEEFRVTTANSNADAGRSSGAQVSLVTKSGTNQFHGSAYEYNRSSLGEANDWFNKASELQSGLPNKPPHLVRNTYGVSFGGPIKKDRLFLFLNWEAQRTRESQQVTRVVPSDNLRNGIAGYISTSGSVVNVTRAQLAAMDPNCSAAGTCPLGPGANPAILQIFNQDYPHANTSAAIGADGINFQGFTFAASVPQNLNTYIAKLDYNITQNGNHRIFVRGNLQGDRLDQPPQFPGLKPDLADVVASKGLAVGYTALLTSNVINNFRYGFIRQAQNEVGVGSSAYIDLRGLDTPHGEENHSFDVAVPVHNFVDDVSWVKGKHTIQFGGNLRMIGDLRNSTLSSFSRGQTNASWLNVSGIANKGTSLDPGAFTNTLGLPAVAPGFNNAWDYPVAALTGLIPEVDARYNFTTKGVTLPEGTPNIRHFVAHEFEMYLQDSWRVKPNLTVTYGLRWTLLQPPYEQNGVQVAPTVSTGAWFKERAQTMLTGSPFNDPIVFDIAGQGNGKKPYWHWDYKDFAPRLAIAYSPNFDQGWVGRMFGGPGKTSIRLGAGMYYDHFGEGVVNTFDRRGSFGLSTLLSNPGGVVTVDDSPRMGMNGLYTLPPSLITASPGAKFPVTFPLTNFAIQSGLDDTLRTPYSYAFDLSVDRELPHRFIVEVSYVGRLGRRLLQQEDLGQPRDIVDPTSKMDYFKAINLLDVQAVANGGAGVAESSVAPIPYWENLFGATSTGAAGASGCAAGAPANPTATQNMYDLLQCGYVHNETTFLQIIDGVGGSPCFPGCITLGGVTQKNPQFFAGQFASLYAWRSIGNASYNAGQFILRHAMTSGLQFDFNYTYSKSIDIGSDTEQIGYNVNLGGPGDQIFNAWSPNSQRAISTFDTTHQINSNWVAEIPYGRGRPYGGGIGRLADTLLGGWDLTGLFRWTSGFPVSVVNGGAWATNWELGAYATQIGPAPQTGVSINTLGASPAPNIFKDPASAIKAYRMDFPGEIGVRNSIRGPGYFGVDVGVDKTFKITETQQLRFSWETFNLFNNVRFDALTANTGIDQSTSFGNFTKTLTVPRKMQLALRYSF
jgi:hypothetical protein